MQKEKVLIITYYWPPSGGPGVQRWLKFAKYLPSCNVEPIIITPHSDVAEYPIRDESLIEDIPNNIEVHHTNNKSLYSIYKKFTKVQTAPYSGFANDANPNLKQKISRFIRGNFFLPDSRKGWNKYALAKAVELIEKYNIKTVITTSPPHSTQLVGLNLKKRFNIKWIADLRDPWTDIYYYNNFYPTLLAKSIDKRYERKVLENADVVISVSDFIKKQFTMKSAHIDEKKIVVIPNGYDSSDFADKNNNEHAIFTISYTGTLAANYDISTLIDSLKDFNKDFLLQFIGKIDENVERLISKSLSGKVEFKGFIPHNESIKTLISSDLLLLVIPVINDNKGILTGKLFEYIGSGKKILCLGPTDGDAAKIISNAKAGSTFDYSDREGISDFINDAYTNRTDNLSEKKEIYSRKSLTMELAKYIHNKA